MMKKLTVLSATLACALIALPAHGKNVKVDVAKSTVLDLPERIVKVSVADPSIADVAVPTKQSLLINGKRSGMTSLIVWTTKARRQYELTVNGEAPPNRQGVDLSLIKTALKRALRQSSDDLQVELVGNRVMLSGHVPEAAMAERAGKVASGFAENVINLVQVQNADQVEVDVQVVEMRREQGHDLGAKWGSLRIMPNGEAVFMGDVMTFAETNPGNTVTFRQFDRLAAQLQLMVREGHAKVLAKPKLVAANGGKASFLVGGEIPIPVSQQLGQVTITWKDYGVKLNVAPTARSDGRIAMRVAPEVSALDYTNAIKINGFLIPALTTRSAETDVILAPGEGLAIGGLLHNSEAQNVEKLPLLGDIPILGNLFKSTQFQKQETELTILVSPRLIRPTAAGVQTGAKP